MAWTLVQKSASVATGTGGTVTGTLPAGSTSGNLIVACLGCNVGGTQFSGPSGWVQAAQVSNGTLSRAEVWYLPPGQNGGAITSATFTSGSGGLRCALGEFSTNVATPVVSLDVTGTGTASNVTTCTVSPAAVTAGDLLVCSFFEHLASASAVTWTDPSGFTLLDSLTTSGQNQAYSAYNLSSGSGTVTITATSSVTAAASGWTGAAAAFKATRGGAALSVATTAVPDGQIGVAYNQALAAAGGTPPYTWSITVGALPAGLTLLSSGGRGGGFGATLRMTQPPVVNQTAITNWQALVGRTVTCQKWYTGGFPTVPDDVIQASINLGMTCYLCYMPPYNPPTTAAYNSLQASLQAFKDAGLVNGKVVLFQEVEDHAPTPAQYKAVVQFYEPAIHAVYPGGLVHDAAGSKPALHQAYFPTTLGIGNLVDEYGIDFYANTYASGARIDAYVALVAATGKRLGVMEMGSSIGTAPVPPDTGPGSVTEYFRYVTRIAAANPPGSFMWYTQDNKNVHNIISDPADFRIPLLQALSDTVAGTSAAGQISGTPTTAGLASFTAKVTDNVAATATAALTINITAASSPVITTLTLPAATTGVAYSQALAETGGTAPFTWSISAGALPDGLALSAAGGTITGTPSAAAATSGFTVTVTDVNGQFASQALFITVVAGAPPPTPAPNQLGFPQIIIEAGLSAAAPVVPAGTFILDDPVYGKLDSGNQLADATAWTDIAALFRSGSISRPSTRVQGPLITYQGGTATGTFDNTTGALDPDNPASPYAGGLRPMIPFQVRAVYGSASYPMWSGFTSSISGADLTYDMGYDEVTITADDGFKILAGVTIPAVPLGSDGVGDGNLEDSGARVIRILNAAGWYTDHRRVTAGDSALQGTLYGDTALNLLQLTADSEIGELYIDGAGNLVFRHRQAILTETRSTQVQAIFGDLPGTVHGSLTELACIPHRRATDDTTLANDIQATSAGGTLQEAESLSSQRTYLFPRSYARSDLLLTDDPTTLAWAQWVLSVSLAGDDRFDAITIDPVADPAALFPQVLAREIGDRIQVWRRPQNSAAVITQDCFIRGIQHDIDAVAGTWSTTWALQSAARYTGFLILDDAVNGKLDTGKLAF